MNAIDVFQDWLDDYLNFERNPKKEIFWLDTIDFLCKRFDNPQDFAPCVHVAGSKGKGSVSRMIACILEEAGYKVGLYSSPHISDFRERISSPSSFLPEEIYEKDEFNNIEIMYKKQIKLNNEIKCLYTKEQEQSIVTIKSADNKLLHAIIKLY